MTVRELVDKMNVKLANDSVSDRMQFQYLEYIDTPVGDYIKYMGQIIWYSEDFPWPEEGEMFAVELHIQNEISILISVMKDTLKVIQ